MSRPPVLGLVVSCFLLGCGGTEEQGTESSSVWKKDSIAIEAWFLQLNAAPQYLWRAAADELTSDDLALVSTLHTVPGALKAGIACDVHSFRVFITDQSGVRQEYLAYDPNCSKTPVLAGDAEGLWSCDFQAHLTGTIDEAPSASPGRCSLLGYSGSAADSWVYADLFARVSLPAGSSHTLTARDTTGITTAAETHLLDASGTTEISSAPAGQSLSVETPGNYVVDLRSVEAGSRAIALEVD